MDGMGKRRNEGGMGRGRLGDLTEGIYIAVCATGGVESSIHADRGVCSLRCALEGALA